MNKESYFTQSQDELQLHFQTWIPDGDIKAIVHLVHGIGEHCGRYKHVGERLNQSGYALLAFDLRGHGKSDGPLGHISSFDHILNDIDLLLAEGTRQFSSLPKYLYGHSLGGNLVINYALRRQPKIHGLIASGPALRLAFEPPAYKIVLAKGMNYIWPTFSQSSGLETGALSRDANVVSSYESDPLVHDQVSARLFVEGMDSGSWALEHAHEINIPTLILHGGADRITSPIASQAFAEQAGSQCCTVKIWEGHYHEIHNEPEKEIVLDYLIHWLDGTLA